MNRNSAHQTLKTPDLQSAAEDYITTRSPENLRLLVEAGRGLVHHFAGIYAPRRNNEDLVQAGYEGLLKAAARYDPARGVSFTTYAGHCIMGEMRHCMRKEASFARSARIAELQQRIDRVMEDYLKRKGETPPLSYIAERVNVCEEGVIEAMRAGWIPLEEVDRSKIQNLRYESFRLPIEDRIALEQAVNSLGDLQRRVITLLFYRDMTQQQAAAQLGISQRRVSRVLHKSLRQMAESLS